MSMWVAGRVCVSTLIAEAMLRVRADGSGAGVGAFGRLCTLGIALDVPLPGAGHAQRLLGDVVRDDGAGRRVGAVADGDGRDEGRVDRRAHVVADGRAVLGAAVVVRGDRRGAQIRVGADVGVPDVREVRHLRARADVRVLDLDVGAGLRLLAEEGARAEVREGTYGRAVAELGVDGDDVRDETAVGPDPGVA